MENPGLSRINHQPSTLRDVVLDHLRNAIIDGVFKPGERLVERVLCERLGVSRTVVRAALQQLAHDRLVELRRNRGAYVAQPSVREAREVFEREYLAAQIMRFGGNISRTAGFIGMERSALHRKLKSLGVSPSRGGDDDVEGSEES